MPEYLAPGRYGGPTIAGVRVLPPIRFGGYLMALVNSVG